ncbi:MAG: bifunctional riboflavin kinase/FAD synthetase [Tissierellaceae bacterium]|nr:bifunctional riboflavin kinase/FAD synthetase [Tissierellaceae bacterium]
MENIKLQNYNEDRFETAIALGNFDGVHIGHKKLIMNMVDAAKDLNLKPSILLFENHTKSVTAGNAPMCLTSRPQKELLVKNLGVEIIYNINFDENLMKLQPEEFVKYILVEKLNTKLVVVGFDYRFGHKASGNVETLKNLANKYGFKVIVIEPIYVDDLLVSSTKIRELIMEGNLELVSSMLDRNYQVIGKVIPGKKIGRTLGFPTANLELIDDYIIPKHGVYRTKTVMNEKTYLSATSVGYNPTFENDRVKIECHIIDFTEKIYDEIIYIEFIEFLRDELKFDSIEELIKQINNDIKTVISRH